MNPLDQQNQTRMLDVGDLMIPHLLNEQVEVYVDNEKLYSNQKQNLIFE